MTTSMEDCDAEASLRETLKRLQLVVSCNTDAYFALDSEFRFLGISPLAHQLIFSDRPVEQLIGVGLWDAYPQGKMNEFYFQYHRAMREQVPVHFVAQSLIANRWFETHAYPHPDRLDVYILDITESRLAEQSRKQERVRLLRNRTDPVPSLVSYVDANFCFRMVNSSYAHWFGQPTAEVCGRPVAEVLGEEVWRRVRPHIEQALRGEAVTCEGRMCAQSAETRFVRVSYTPDRDKSGKVRGVVVLVNDITETKQTEEALRHSERMLVQAQRMAHVGSWELDLDNLDQVNKNHLRWSDESFRIFGYEPGRIEVTNELFFSRVHPDDREAIRRAVAQSLAEGIPYEVEHRILLPDGTQRIVHEWAELLTDAEGKPIRMLGTIQDVTEQKRGEEALKVADRRKDEFLATLAHELRNPLAAIGNAIHILEIAAGSAETVAKAREIMARQLQYLVRLVDDLLDVSRIMRGKIELRNVHTRLDLIVARAVEMVQAFLDAQRHELTVALPAEPLVVDVDPVRLEQVLVNLLTNAAKYTEQGGQIRLSVEREQDFAVLRVRDNGMGIATELLPNIFQPFVQGIHDGGRTQGGLGLGLAVVKKITEMHGGTVEAKSAGVGQGSEFIMRLPLPPRPRPALEPHPRDQKEAARPAPRHVLVVDDNADAADSLGMLLRLCGHNVQTVDSGAAALELAERQRPDIVFLELGMPGMDGYELARRLRKRFGAAPPLLVALTGWGQKEDYRRSQEAGFDVHLTKPAERAALLQLLAKAAGQDGWSGAAEPGSGRLEVIKVGVDQRNVADPAKDLADREAANRALGGDHSHEAEAGVDRGREP